MINSEWKKSFFHCNEIFAENNIHVFRKTWLREFICFDNEQLGWLFYNMVYFTLALDRWVNNAFYFHSECVISLIIEKEIGTTHHFCLYLFFLPPIILFFPKFTYCNRSNPNSIVYRISCRNIVAQKGQSFRVYWEPHVFITCSFIYIYIESAIALQL